jgi:phospholipase C
VQTIIQPIGDIAMASKNELIIADNSGTITGIDYVPNSVRKPDGVKSSGSPSVSKSASKSGNVFTITFECNRKGNKGVADSFKSSSGDALNRYAAKGGKSGGPGELNFWFSLKVNVATARGAAQATLNVGQGHHSLTDNNWWLGGSIVDGNQPALRIPLGSGKEEVTLPLRGGVSDYTLSAGHFARDYPINYVFVLMLENHSFDNMFAMSGIQGITAATTRDSNSYDGQTYKVNAGGVAQMPTDPLHNFQDVVDQLAGQGTNFPHGGPYPAINNSGFAANYATTLNHHHQATSPGLIMSCIETPNLAPVIYSLATNFVLCDHWFSSLPGPTWPNRFFVHGASSNGLETSQTFEEMAKWMFVDGFEYPHGSIYDALKSENVAYALYADTENAFSNDPAPPRELGELPQVASLKGISVLSVKNVLDLPEDLKGNYKAQYTFIEPNYGDIFFDTYKGGSSQHAMDDLYGGEGLIKFVYEKIRNSPLWNESLLIITYDEHGGFYDSVAPGSITEPGDGSNSSKLNKFGFQFNQAGVRVPAILVSPWLGKGVIDKTVYDHTSVLATAEKVLNIKPLTDRDKHAKNPLHLLLESARTDCPTTLPKPVLTVPKADPKARAAMRERKLDDFLPFHGNLVGALGVLLKLDIELSDGSKAARAEALARYRSLRTRRDAQAYAKRIMAKAGGRFGSGAVETGSGAGSKAKTKRRRPPITAARKARRRRAPKRAR